MTSRMSAGLSTIDRSRSYSSYMARWPASTQVLCEVLCARALRKRGIDILRRLWALFITVTEPQFFLRVLHYDSGKVDISQELRARSP
jgi:hypothetical protein